MHKLHIPQPEEASPSDLLPIIEQADLLETQAAEAAAWERNAASNFSALEGLHMYFVTVVCAYHSFTSGSERCAKSRTFRAAFLLLLIGEPEETVELIDRVVCSASSC